MNRPLLVIDGDSFAHRAFHALPKSIRRTGDRGGGAIVGFAKLLLRLYEGEQPRAVLVGWDTLGAPTYRQALFPAYQSGRQFDDELVEQLEVEPQMPSLWVRTKEMLSSGSDLGGSAEWARSLPSSS